MRLLKVSYIKGPSIWTVTQFWVCISPHPSEKMLHIPKKPSRATPRSLQLLYIKPPQFCAAHLSCKLKVRMVYHCWMPLEKQKHKTKRYNAEQVRWDANSWVRTCCLFFFFWSFFSFSFFLFFSNSLKEIGKEGMFRADAIRGAFLSLEISGALSQRNLHLPWEFTASQQKFGKHFHLKD